MELIKAETESTTLLWDVGTAYELFVSLHVLHEPEFYELRPSWAAGIRSRIALPERTFLEEIVPFLGMPQHQLKWVYHLDGTKDARTAIHALRTIPPSERGITLMGLRETERHGAKRLLEIGERASWDKDDLDALSPILCRDEPKHDASELVKFLERWQHQSDFGKMLLLSLEAYYQAFFEKEEQRIGPFLEAGLENAQRLAEHLQPLALIAELSRGYYPNEPLDGELILVPNFWMTPLICLESFGAGQKLFLFGARPATVSAIPGEQVPDGLLRILKALADPTRLKIMRYLYEEELGPTELARRLDLRGPTIIHHLKELRLAGLVNLTIKGQEKRYRARLESFDETNADLKKFITCEAVEEPGPDKNT